MNKRFTGKWMVLSLMMLLSICQSGCVQVFAADGKGRLSGQVEYNRVSPPAAGVRLLNQILDRVRSTPAFAMMNKDKGIRKGEQTNLPQLGISNYQLAIKPKESPRANCAPPPPQFRFAKASAGASLVPATELRGPGVHFYKANSQMTIVNESAASVQVSEGDLVDLRAERQDVGANLKMRRKEALALLPPNVATGIPLVRLGITQAEAGVSLKAWGSMREEVIGNWTVWSFQKPNSEEPLLQVYMRHGLVEALRIFDANLVGRDLGVGLGDQVRVLKEQFGEPSFILSEPLPGAGQNYVYPLSQVAFLLSRPDPRSEPEVVSLLIFNVK